MGAVLGFHWKKGGVSEGTGGTRQNGSMFLARVGKDQLGDFFSKGPVPISSSATSSCLSRVWIR